MERFDFKKATPFPCERYKNYIIDGKNINPRTAYTSDNAWLSHVRKIMPEWGKAFDVLDKYEEKAKPERIGALLITPRQDELLGIKAHLVHSLKIGLAKKHDNMAIRLDYR